MPESKYWQFPHGYTLFCDDIRLEVGNKQTIVGLYNKILYVPQYPQFIPRMGFHIYYGEPMRDSLPELTAKVLYEIKGQDDLVLFEAVVTEDQRKNTHYVGPQGGDSTIASVNFAGMISPLVVTGDSCLKARVYRDGEEIPLGRLWIAAGTSEQMAATPVPAPN